MTEPIDLQAAMRFIVALAGDEKVPCCWQTFSDRKDVDEDTKRQLAAHRTAPFQHVAAWLWEMNDRGAGIYVTVNATDGNGRQASNIVGLRALFVDSDGTPLPSSWALTPSILVQRDDTHWHAYWLLLETEAAQLARFTRAQAQLAHALSTDRAVKDLPRVMRVPGFLHRKGDPCAVSLVHGDRLRRFTIDEVLAAFPLPAGVELDDAGREVKQDRPKAAPTQRPLRSDAELEADESLSDAEWMFEQTRKWAAKVDTTEGAANHYRGRDNAAFTIASECHARGLSDDRALDLVLDYFARAGGGDDEDARRIVRSAFSKPRNTISKDGIPQRRRRQVPRGTTGGSQPPADPPATNSAAGSGGEPPENPFGLDLARLEKSWRIAANGVWPIEYSQRHDKYEDRPNKRVADLPIWPELQGVDVAGGGSYWRLAWYTPHGETKRAWLAEAEMKSGIALVALEDAPVAKRTCEYCAVWLTAARCAVTAPATKVTTRLGWCGRGEERQWVWPEPGGEEHDYTYIGGDLEPGGDLKVWKAGLDHLLELPDTDGFPALVVLGFAVGAAFSRVAGARNPILGLMHDSSTGKGSSLGFALSAWCNPDTLTVPAGSSSKGLQDLAQGIPDCPVMLDDLQQLAETYPHQAADALYYLANGQRRITSSKTQVAVGGERRYGVGFYSAENPILPGQNTGVHYRVIELNGAMLPDEETAKRLQRASKAYGAVAPRLAKQVRSRPFADWRTLLQGYASAIRAARTDPKGACDLRGDDCEQLGLLRVGLETIFAALELAPRADNDQPLAEAVTVWLAGRLAEQRRNTRDRETEALFRIVDLVMGLRWGGDWSEDGQQKPEDGSRPQRTLDGKRFECERAGDRDGYIGWRLLSLDPATPGHLSRLEVNSTADAIARLFREYGGELRLLTSWARRGWIERDGKHLKPKKSFQGRIIGRVVRFTAAALDLYLDQAPPPPPEPSPLPHHAPHHPPHPQTDEPQPLSA